MKPVRSYSVEELLRQKDTMFPVELAAHLDRFLTGDISVFATNEMCEVIVTYLRRATGEDIEIVSSQHRTDQVAHGPGVANKTYPDDVRMQIKFGDLFYFILYIDENVMDAHLDYNDEDQFEQPNISFSDLPRVLEQFTENHREVTGE